MFRPCGSAPKIRESGRPRFTKPPDARTGRCGATTRAPLALVPKTTVEAPSIDGAVAVPVRPVVSLKFEKNWPPKNQRRSLPVYYFPIKVAKGGGGCDSLV